MRARTAPRAASFGEQMNTRVRIRTTVRIACLIAVALVAPALHAQQPAKPPTLVIVTNGGDATVSIFDVMSAPKLVATVPVGNEPRELCVAPDGARAYIMNRADNSVSVLDLASYKATATITHAKLKRPEGCAVATDSKRLYVASADADALLVVSTDNNQVIKDITVPKLPRRVAVSPDGRKVYVSSEGTGEITAINAATDAVLATIKTANSARNMAFMPDGKSMYVIHSLQDTVSLIDTEANKLVTTIGVSTSPQEIAITSDGELAFVLSRGAMSINVIWTNPTEPRKSFRSVELQPWPIDMVANDRNIYVIHDRDDALSVVRTRTLETFAYQTTKTGKSPQGIAMRR
jgi:YVTN family beta-propeller protein